MSDAVGSERISRVVGYKIEKGDFSEVTPNLPRKIAIFAEANTANQGTLDVTPKVITSAGQAGQLYGFGSPIYQIMRILRPLFGGGIGGIPTVVVPQPEVGGAANKQISITPIGIATGNGTHKIVIAGRDNLDGESYDIPVATGDTTDILAGKIEDVVNSKLGCPLLATSDDYQALLTTKWKGLTANDVVVRVDVGDDDLGLTYTINTEQAATGTPSVSAGLVALGNEWYTEIINSYGTVDSIMTAFETWNGVPGVDNPTGRFAAILMKPAVVITGSTDEDPTSITDPRKDQVTIALAPAPLSEGLPLEAAANMCLLFSRKAQDTPAQDVGGDFYPDMPTPDSIGAMSNYDNRDAFVKLGSSTVDLVAGRYKVMDFVTTYHPVGETPPQFRYVRDLYSVDLNVYFGYYLKEQMFVVDHVIVSDTDVVSAAKVIQPKQWKQIIDKYAAELADRALITEKAFMQKSIVVKLDTANPNRLNTTFKYKRSSIARIASTVATAGFNLGTLN